MINTIKNIDTKKRIRFFFLWLSGLILIFFGASGARHQLRHENQINVNNQSIINFLGSMNRQISERLKVLNTLFQNDHIIDILKKPLLEKGDDRVQAILESAKEISNAALIYVMDSTGTVRESSIYGNGKTLIGKNYKFRPYFTRAMKGETVLYPALGVTTHKRGLYVSTPLFFQNGKTAGVIVIKIGLESIDELLKNSKSPRLLVSPDGVIFSSNREEWFFKTIKILSMEDQMRIKKNRQFANKELSPLSWNFRGDSVIIDGYDFHILREHLPIKGWQIIALYNISDMPVLTNIQNILLWSVIFVLIVLLTTVLLLVISIQLRRKTEKELKTVPPDSLG